MRFLSLILVMSTLGCTTTNSSLVVLNKEPYHYVDSSFKKTLALFEMMAATKGMLTDDSNLSVTFGLVRSKKSSTVGTCQQDEIGTMIIKIHDESWAKMDAYQREELVLHELGHCLLDRPHCTVKDKKMPISIMYPSVLPKEHYKKNRKELINELFDFDRRCETTDDDADESIRTLRIPSNR